MTETILTLYDKLIVAGFWLFVSAVAATMTWAVVVAVKKTWKLWKGKK